MKVLRILGYALAAAVVVVVVWRLDLGAVWDVLREVDVGWAALAVLLNLPIAVLIGGRSRLVLRRLGYELHGSLLLSTAILGYVLGSVTPAGAGDFLRAKLLRDRARVAVNHGVALVAFERATSFFLLTLTTGASLLLVVTPVVVWPAVFALAGAGCFAPWLAALALARIGARRPRPEGDGLLARWGRSIIEATSQLRSLSADAGLVLSWSVVSVAVFVLMGLQVLLLARSVQADIGLHEAWLAYGGSTLAIIVTFLPLGIGIGDGSLAALLHQTGLSLEQGTAVAILVRGTITLPLLIAALAAYVPLSLGGAGPPLAAGHAIEDSAGGVTSD